MCVVPSVSVGKLRRAVINAGTGEPVVQQQMSTSFDGLGATRPPPSTNISPLKLKARVSPVARGIAAIVPMVLTAGLKLNEVVVSTTVPPW
jgi:sirohydrochlorin ferrochelatase